MAFYPCGQSHNLSDLAHKATHDSLGQQIDATYIKDIDVDDVFLKLTKGNGTIVTHELEIFATEIMTVPSEMSSLTYTGTEQSPIWRDYDPEQLELSGVVSAVVDGTYTATFTPKSGYKWGDGTGKTPKDINWTINAIVISTKPSLKAELTYSGATQSPVWNNYDSSKLTLSGTTSAIEDGTYTATFTPKTGYAWSDGTKTPYNVTWIINPVVISAIPSASDLTYNTAEQSPTWSNYDSLQLTIGGSTAGTNAGTYTATFTPKTGYVWSDGTKATKSVNWSIGKAAGSMSLSATSVTLNADNLTQTVMVTRAGDGAISASSDNTGVATVSVSGNTVTISNVNQTSGSATITVNVAEGTNYYAPSGHTIVVNCTFTIYISEYPSVENSVLKYSGGVQTPVFVNYDTEQLNISGTYTATDVGDYTATFTPKDGYAFEDGSESKSVSWGIYYIWGVYNYTSQTLSRYEHKLYTSGQRLSYGQNWYSAYTRDYETYKNSGSWKTISSKLDASRYASTYKYMASGIGAASKLYEITSYDASMLTCNVWWAPKENYTAYTPTTKVGEVHSTNASEYPDNNKSGDYWYVKQ